MNGCNNIVFTLKMNAFIFGYDDPLMYNCSKYTESEWDKMRKPSLIMGLVYICFGSVYCVLYIPILFVLTKPTFFKRPCYRIMLYLGIVDVLCLLVISYGTGYFSLNGISYCNKKTLSHVLGSCAISLWATSCAACCLLAINRCLTILKPKVGSILFSGWRTNVFLLLPTLNFLYFFFFTPPVVFSSNRYANFFNPFIDVPGFDFHVEEIRYNSTAHTVNNLIDAFVLCFTYCTFCYYVAKVTTDRTQGMINRTFAQAAIICGVNGVAAIVCVIMQFIETPMALNIFVQVSWQASHGCPVFIYLIMNRSIRRAVLELFCIQTQQVTAASTSKLNHNKVSQLPTKGLPTLSAKFN